MVLVVPVRTVLGSVVGGGCDKEDLKEQYDIVFLVFQHFSYIQRGCIVPQIVAQVPVIFT